MKKPCPRCGRPFMCNHGDIARCWCVSVRVSPEARVELSAGYSDCLCEVCLGELNEESAPGIPQNDGRSGRPIR